MKVLYITNSGGWGGASVALKNIWTQLEDRIEISVLFPNKGMLSEYAEKQNYKCFYLRYDLEVWPQFNSFNNLIKLIPRLLYKKVFQYSAYRKLIKIIKELKPNIIHTNVGPLHFAAKAANKCKIPHIWHLREYQIKDFQMHPFPSLVSFKKRLAQSYKIVITKDIANYFDLKTNYKVIYDGVISSKQIIPEISFDDSEYLLFVGRLEDAKGWKDVLNAFISISPKYPQIRMLFAGEYNEKEINEIKKTIIPTKIQKRIEFLGFRTDCEKLMRKARALLVASKSEGFGFITTEGMYNGCIVIGRNTSGTKEQFDNGLKLFDKEIGFRFETQKEFVKQIEIVLSKPKLYFKQMIENAQKATIELYSIEKNASEILNQYNHII